MNQTWKSCSGFISVFGDFSLSLSLTIIRGCNMYHGTDKLDETNSEVQSPSVSRMTLQPSTHRLVSAHRKQTGPRFPENCSLPWATQQTRCNSRICYSCHRCILNIWFIAWGKDIESIVCTSNEQKHDSIWDLVTAKAYLIRHTWDSRRCVKTWGHETNII